MRVTVTVPKYREYSPRTTEFVIEEFCQFLGGATIYTGDGVWLDKYGDMVYDAVKVVESYTDKTGGEIGPWLHDIASEAASLIEQDTVMYTIDNENYYS